MTTSTARSRGATAVRALLVTALALTAVVALPTAPASAATVPNLLSVNQASVESSLSGFTRGARRETISRTCAAAVVGRCSLRLVSTTTSSMAVRTIMQGQVVTAGTTYTASTLVRPVSTSRTPAPARLVLAFTSSSGRTLATAAGPWTPLRIGRWTRAARIAATAPAGTASVSVWLWIASKRTNDAYLADGWGLWGSPTLQPWSLPVVSPDTIDPTPPASPTMAASSDPSTLTLAWGPATDNVAVRRYLVTLTPGPGTSGGTVTGSTTGRAWTSPLLTPGTWDASIVAVDGSGRAGAPARTSAMSSLPPSTVNLLTADQAGFEGSIAGIDPASGASTTVALARTTAVAAHGTAALRMTAEGAGTLKVRTSRTWTRAAQGSSYSGSLLVTAGAGVPVGRVARLELRFYAADPTVPARIVQGPQAGLAPGTWTRLTGSSVAQAGEAYVTVGLVISSAAAGETFTTDDWGLWRSASAPVWALPPARTARPTVAVLGDSYESGLGASYDVLRWSSLLSTRYGWREANLGRGGTGFATTSDVTGCGLVSCPTIPDMAAAAVASRPDVVIVSGGRNDLTAYAADPATVQSGIEQTLATLRAGLPSARIIVVSPMWDSSAPNPALTILAGWEKTSASAHGASFLDGASGWLVGHPEWIADGVHPNDLGYAEIARQISLTLG